MRARQMGMARSVAVRIGFGSLAGYSACRNARK